MTQPSPVHATPIAGPPAALLRLAGRCAYASGIASIFGIAFLVIFFSIGGIFGPLNDVMVIIHYALLLPILVALHRIVHRYNPPLSAAAAVLGVAGIAAVVVLQALLVAGVLPFTTQIWLVVPAFLVVLACFVLIWELDRQTGILPGGVLLHVLAGLYIGYPFWAFALGRRLLNEPPGRS